MKISDPRKIDIKNYTYGLPDDRIAKYPLAKRDASKLLVYKQGNIINSNFSQIESYIPADSLMVFNNTKVIQARLHFQKATGAHIEIFCLEPHIPHDYILNFQETQKCSWVCLIGNLKKWKEGDLIKLVEVKGICLELRAKLLKSTSENHIVEFEWDNSNITFSDLLEVVGNLPIPPYLNRDTEDRDKETYQTVYSKIEGSVAAPTAGLHFTPQIIGSLKNNGVETSEVTLHVGAGTFRPVKSEQIGGHKMHSEFISIRKEVIEQLIAHRGKVISVGTTSARTLESLYYIGELIKTNPSAEHLHVEQWQPYSGDSNKLSKEEALTQIIDYLDRHGLTTLVADTEIIIAPGYDFRIVDGIVTNFHQPQSTLLLLVSAFVGEGYWTKIYDYALENEYRFLSYGDSSLLLK